MNWKGLVIGVSFIGLLLGWAPTLGAQNAPPEQSPSLKAISHWRFPLITQSSRDGLLVGFDLRLTTGPWELRVGMVYGLGSRAIHYRSGATIAELFSLEYRDWPGSPVVGREGERGLQLAVSQHDLALLGFYGTLWQTPRESKDPTVAYLRVSDRLQQELPLGARLQLQGEFLIGTLLAAPSPELFRTFSSFAQLTLDQTTLRLQYGQLANPGGLSDLRFRFGLRSYPATFQGDRFLVASLERRFDLFTVQLSTIDLSSLLGPLGGSVPVLLRGQGELFFEGGEVWLSEIPQGGILSGWGVGLIFSDLNLRLDVAFNAQGEPRLHFQSSLVEF